MQSHQQTDNYLIDFVNNVIREVNDYIRVNENKIKSNEKNRRDDVIKIMQCLYGYGLSEFSPNSIPVTINKESLNSHLPTKNNPFIPFPPVKVASLAITFNDMFSRLAQILSEFKTSVGNSSLRDNINTQIKFLIENQKKYSLIAEANHTDNTNLTRSSSLNLFTLPNDLLMLIIRFCDIKTIGIIAATSRRLQQMANNELLWKSIAESKSQLSENDLEIMKSKHGSFKLFVNHLTEKKCYIVCLIPHGLDPLQALNDDVTSLLRHAISYDTYLNASIHTLNMSGYGHAPLILEANMLKSEFAKLAADKKYNVIASRICKIVNFAAYTTQLNATGPVMLINGKYVRVAPAIQHMAANSKP